jgi:ketosteroid isomerase-like protein
VAGSVPTPIEIFEQILLATHTVKDTGEPYDQSYVGVLTAREGRITRYRDYWNPLKSLGTALRGEQ